MKLPPNTIFFTDRDLAKQFPAILAASGLKVEPYHAHFDQDTTDPEWLTEVGRRGWYVLSKDWHMRYRDRERDAIMSSGVGAFIIKGNATHSEHARAFVKTLGPVLRFIERHPRPFIAKVYRPSQGRTSGRVEMWLSEEEWRAWHAIE